MRAFDDLIRVRVSTYLIADLDWERIEADPNWELVSRQFDITDPKEKQTALFRYLGEYIAREQLLINMPCTNGPSDLYITDMEVINGNSNSEQIPSSGEERDDSLCP
jgi:hypothetical protein